MSLSASRQEEANRVNLFLHHENTRIFAQQDRHLPVTVVTGFLGAGKTTLLHHILTNKSNLKIAAAINDFASLNIDEKLVASKQTASQIVELSNGCVCCHLLGDLQQAVWNLLQNDVALDKIHYLVVETSGVSDPLQIIRTLDAKFGKCFRARLDSVVTVVDADQLLHTTTQNSSAVAQLSCADVILLNKMDLLSSEQQVNEVETKVRAVNSDAVVYKTQRCKVPLSAIMDVTIPSDANSAANAITHEASAVPIYVSATGGALRRSSSSVVSNGNSDTTTHLHGTDDFVSTSISLSTGPLSLVKLQQFICSPVVRQLARMKGVLWLSHAPHYRSVLHMSGRGRLGFELDEKWTGPPSSEIAFIGNKSAINVELLKNEFRACCESETVAQNDDKNENGGLEMLRKSKEFVVTEHTNNGDSSCHYFRLSGSKVYGYTEEEIERDLRIDTDSMNQDVADAVNASVDEPKAFLAYTKNDNDKILLCYPGSGEPANNAAVLFREARKILAVHFRNVQVCKCGA